MPRQFVYPPNDPKIILGIRSLAVQQWAKWQSARSKQGVVWGAREVPGISHPDILEEFEKLPLHIQDFTRALTYSRVMFFASLGKEQVKLLITAAREGQTISEELTEVVAKGLHQGWWLLRQAWGLSGHSGDKHWNEETEAEQANDLRLVPGWAELLSACELSEDENLKALVDFILA